MGRIYTGVFEQVAVTAVQDLFELVAPSDAVVAVHALYLSQNTDVGDGEAEALPILIHRGSTSGSGGTTPTARPMNVGDAAFGGTLEVNNTSQSTEGNQILAIDWNIRAPLEIVWTPETRPILSPSGRINVELQAAPTDSITCNGTLIFEEIGG